MDIYEENFIEKDGFWYMFWWLDKKYILVKFFIIYIDDDFFFLLYIILIGFDCSINRGVGVLEGIFIFVRCFVFYCI